MSKSWSGGSTTRWRKLRLEVLNRDRWVCQLCHESIDKTLPMDHPRSAQVHHKFGKINGDDPRHLIACHRECNLKIGDPNSKDPRPITRTKW